MDTIYYGGPILTMETENDSPEAVLVSKGIIKKVGTLKETMDAAGSSVRKYNLDGRCLMPSFIVMIPVRGVPSLFRKYFSPLIDWYPVYLF